MPTENPLNTILKQNIMIDSLLFKEEHLIKLLEDMYDVNVEYRNQIAILERALDTLKNDRLHGQKN